MKDLESAEIIPLSALASIKIPGFITSAVLSAPIVYVSFGFMVTTYTSDDISVPSLPSLFRTKGLDHHIEALLTVKCTLIVNSDT